MRSPTEERAAANRLWLRDSRKIVQLAEEIIKQQRFFLSRPGVSGERARTYLFVEGYAIEMLRTMKRARKRDEREPEILYLHVNEDA